MSGAFARANRDEFAVPLATAALLAGLDRPWFVAGGWAIDLVIGRVTRPHKDLEVAIARSDQWALRDQLAGWAFEYVPGGAGSGYAPWPREEWLTPPIHELYARRSAGEPAVLEILLNEIDGDTWRFRRNQAVTLPLAAVGRRSPLGVPCLAPAVALLYKAKQPRPTDETDFASVLPLLDAAQRRWLDAALAICHPDHPWRGRLADHPDRP